MVVGSAIFICLLCIKYRVWDVCPTCARRQAVSATKKQINTFFKSGEIHFSESEKLNQVGEGAKKKEKKLTNVSFMYVCVARNGEMLVFFSFFLPTIV